MSEEQGWFDGGHAAGDSTPRNYEVIPVDHPDMVAADSTHEAAVELARQVSALKAQLAKYEKPADVFSAPLGGVPIQHHLHLVDGRVIPNHGGHGTHYSEVLPDGSERVTRIREYFPADEGSPVGKYA